MDQKLFNRTVVIQHRILDLASHIFHYPSFNFSRYISGINELYLIGLFTRPLNVRPFE
jgi:hypothetical protein